MMVFSCNISWVFNLRNILYKFNVSILTQKTISKKLSFSGIGIHSGKSVKLDILPAGPNTGIIFKRVDLKKNNLIYPLYNNVSDTKLCTTISNKQGVRVSTIEHLMGALYGIGIDNVIIELDSEEVPILDGSARIFVEGINKTGIAFSDQPIKIIKINKNISLNDGDKSISLDTSNVTSEIEFEIKYKNKIINTQKNKINIFEDNLEGNGGSLENAIVVKNNEILNKEGLRNNLEFVNHKILDCMGDLFLSGYKIIGSLKCSQGGHNLTNKLLRKIFSDRENFSLIEIKGKQLPHTFANYQNLKSIA